MEEKNIIRKEEGRRKLLTVREEEKGINSEEWVLRTSLKKILWLQETKQSKGT